MRSMFDDIVLAVSFAIVRNHRLATGDGGNDGLDPALVEKRAQPIGVISLVGKQPLDRSSGAEELLGHHHIMQITGSNHQDARPAGGIGQRMDLGRAAAA